MKMCQVKNYPALMGLAFAALLLVTGCALVPAPSNLTSRGLTGGDLPPCPGSYDASTWSGCYGSLAATDGNKYVDEFRDGRAHGQGTATNAAGLKYVGEFRDNKYHGQGTATLADGTEYVGEFRAGKYSGQGTATFPSGEKYVGEFKNGKRHGQGTFLWPKGSQYEGKFKGDKPHGQGTYTFTDIGKVAEGIWENGCPIEFCIYELMAK